MQQGPILIVFGVQHREKLYESDCSFGHPTLILSLHYHVKWRLMSLLFASGVNVCRLHLCCGRTFWAHAVIKRMRC